MCAPNAANTGPGRFRKTPNAIHAARYTHNQTGRFWKCVAPEDNIDAFLYYKQTLSASEFGALFAATGGNITSGSGLSGGPVKELAMALLPEMYNALARSINSVTQAVPLSWRTLRWNIYGYSVGLDKYGILGETGGANPRVGYFIGFWDALANNPHLASGIGVLGGYYQVINGGTTNLDGNALWNAGDITFFSYTGVWQKNPTVPTTLSNQTYGGPVPLDQFVAFDPGSQYYALMIRLGVAIRTEADFPGGFDNGVAASFASLKTKWTAQAVFYDKATATTASATATPTSADGLTLGTIATDISMALVTEALSTINLINGQATGAQCAGTWDGNSPPPSPGIGQFYVLSQGNGIYVKGDICASDGAHFCSPRRTGTQGQAHSQYTGDWDLSALSNYAYCEIADIKSAVEAYGFNFNFVEMFAPLRLDYMDNVVTGTGSTSKTLSRTGSFDFPVDRDGGGNITVLGQQMIDGLGYFLEHQATAVLINFVNNVVNGAQLKFAVNSAGLWKQGISNTGISAPPVALVNIRAAIGHSPIMRCITAVAGIENQHQVQVAAFSGGFGWFELGDPNGMWGFNAFPFAVFPQLTLSWLTAWQGDSISGGGGALISASPPAFTKPSAWPTPHLGMEYGTAGGTMSLYTQTNLSDLSRYDQVQMWAVIVLGTNPAQMATLRARKLGRAFGTSCSTGGPISTTSTRRLGATSSRRLMELLLMPI